MSEKIIDLPYIEREVGEHTYRCNRLLLSDWLELEAIIVRLLHVQVADIDERNLADYIIRAISTSSKADHEQVFALMGKCLGVRNPEGGWSQLSRQTQERWWPAYIAELPTILGMFFEIQFADFFSGLAPLSPGGES
jgi:hypothetical protein